MTAPTPLVEKIGARWIARVSYDDRHLAKEAGFRWDRDCRCWYTTDAAVAAKLGSPDDLRAEVERRNAERDAAIAASRASDADIELPVPEGLSYLPYQRAGIAFGLRRPAILLGDDMGLGKTIQAIGIISADESVRRVLIVCPASLKLNWQRELMKWLVRPMTVEIAGPKFLPSSQIVVINYDILKKHIDAIRKVQWDMLVCDESHYLKNPKAQRTQLVVGSEGRRGTPDIPGIQARRRICLSGTPIPNRPVEGWPVFHFLDPETFPKFFPYAIRYCNGHQDRHGWDFSGASNLGELQDKLRSSIMIRRKKADVLTELPAKRRQVVELELDREAAAAVKAEAEQWARHEAGVEAARVAVELAKAGSPEEYADAIARLRVLTQAAFTELSSLRHRTAVSKIPLVIDHLRDMIDQGIKVVCFAHHKDVIDGIGAEFPGHVRVTGDTPLPERQRAVDRFQSDPDCLLFLGNIQAAGVGLTLTASSNVVFAELDWVPGNVTQAEDRCHRIGQTDTVHVQHLVLDGSLDAKMAKTLVVKQEIIDQALDRETVRGEMAPAIPTSERERAATESLTREKVAEAAQQITPDQVEAVHECLRRLAEVCDGAREKDRAGFNAMDSQIGKSLAHHAFLTPRQAALGLKIITKYRRQLPVGLLAQAKGEK